MAFGMTACGGSGGSTESSGDGEASGDGNVVNVYFASDIEEMVDGAIEAY